MSESEGFLDRILRQKDWNIFKLSEINLMICGSNGMALTLALAAVCSGIMNVTLVCRQKDRKVLFGVSQTVMGHLGAAARYVPVYSPGFVKAKIAPHNRYCVWVIDAGDETYDELIPSGQDAYYYAECRAKNGAEFIAFGTNAAKVKSHRKGCVVGDRAEIPAVCAHLLIGILADLGVCKELAPLAPVARFPLPKIPPDPVFPTTATLYAGGGGAIAQQEMWAESLDPVLKRIHQNGHITIVDPKTVHESCRSRQWAYGPETLFKPKAKMTARWLRHLFPGVRVSVRTERLKEKHFQMFSFNEAISSIDNWSGRKRVAWFSHKYAIPWWSAGSSFLGGYARQLSATNTWCASADDGVERLADRPDDEDAAGTSCSAEVNPLQSSVLPQMIIGSHIACQRRDVWLGRASDQMLARGIEVHLTHGSRCRGYKGLRMSPGRRINLKKRDLRNSR
jgi:molybdopterin/thiamine biosynthesis adenylyltransferase